MICSTAASVSHINFELYSKEILLLNSKINKSYTIIDNYVY